MLLLVVAVVAGAGYEAYQRTQRAFFSASCAATAGGTTMSFSPEQTANAALIAALSVKRGLPPRAATIAIATSIQESKLLNLTYGDRDSVGLFQQRPSQGWGTKEQILDPIHSTNAFYDALVKVRDYQTRPIGEVAQAVQRSAYPTAYADHEQQGRVLASTLTGQSPAGLGCALEPVMQAADGTAVAADLTAQFGLPVTLDGAQLVVTTSDSARAWAVAQWAVARASAYGLDRVDVGGRRWTRAADDGALGWGTGSAATTEGVVIRIGNPTG